MINITTRHKRSVGLAVITAIVVLLWYWAGTFSSTASATAHELALWLGLPLSWLIGFQIIAWYQAMEITEKIERTATRVETLAATQDVMGGQIAQLITDNSARSHVEESTAATLDKIEQSVTEVKQITKVKQSVTEVKQSVDAMGVRLQQLSDRQQAIYATLRTAFPHADDVTLESQPKHEPDKSGKHGSSAQGPAKTAQPSHVDELSIFEQAEDDEEDLTELFSRPLLGELEAQSLDDDKA